MIMKNIAQILIAFGSLVCYGCGPIKGYPGPELPSSQLVTIATSTSTTGDLTYTDVDGISFANRSVQVLPGRHTLNTRFTDYGTGENCGMDRRFDDCPACRENREASCRQRNPDNPSLCNSYLTEEMHVMCDYVHTSYSCWIEATLSRPGSYLISVAHASDQVRLTGPNLDIPFRCSFDTRSIHRERMR
jgi:hypothetical protein